MKLLRKLPILIMLLMLTISIGFFAPLKPADNIDVSYADITGVSGEVIYFTGAQGYKPYHYFYDANKQSTLTGAEVNTNSIKYVDDKGQESTSRYVIQGNSDSISNKTSSGYVDFYLTSEMKNFAQSGNLYVQAVCGVISKGNDQNDKVKLRLSQDDVFEEFTSSYRQTSGTAKPQWWQSDFYQVTPNSPINFYFSSLDKGSSINKCEFEIYEPKLIFKVVVDEISFDTTREVVYPGKAIANLNASNIALDQTGTSEYVKYYKNLLNISYEITQGSEYAQIIGKALFINDNAINNSVIKVRAKCAKDSIDREPLYSQEKTFVVNATKYTIDIISDFQSPGIFYGEGEFFEGEKITLKVEPNQNFVFKNWIINGKEETGTTVYYDVKRQNDIKCNLIRETKVVSISGKEKVYDGSTDVDYIVVLDGVEDNHDVRLSGINVSYYNANVENQKILEIKGYPVLTGNDASLYSLSSNKIPNGYGNIIAKEIEVLAKETYQIYGDAESILSYQAEGIVEGESLKGKLIRAPGQSVGEYAIQIGTLQDYNPNYSIKFTESKYIIKPRPISFNIDDIEKTYDKNVEAEIKYEIINKMQNDDVHLILDIQYSDPNVGYKRMLINRQELYGQDKSNYYLQELNECYGEIKAKEINVKAKSVLTIFGETKDLVYDVEGLIEGDVLEGSLSREEGEDVGDYQIYLNNLHNANYKINFESAVYVITKRQVTIIAQEMEKTYGENDPKLLYEVINGVEGYNLQGNLEREKGENVGVYSINIGTLYSYNYDITFMGSNLIINKRKTDLNVTILNKIYDKTVDAKYSYSFSNLAKGDLLSYFANVKFVDCNVGINKEVIIDNRVISGENLDNYEIRVFENNYANISRKDVVLTVKNLLKIYGEEDPQFVISYQGVINGDLLQGRLSRQEGNDAGTYEITLDTLNNQNNPNYNIIYKDIAYLTIKQAPITIISKNISKIYGEDDPEFLLSIKEENSLKYDDRLEDIIEGNVRREEGEIPGKYKINQGTLTTNQNYFIQEFVSSILTIEKRNVFVKAIATSKIYGESDPNFLYSVENEVIGQPLNLKLKREYGEDVGTYTITYTSLSDFRYNISFTDAIFTITPSKISVKADKKIKEYGNQDPIFTVSIIEGQLQNNDILENITFGKLNRTIGENVGEYNILQGDFNLGKNYDVKFEGNTFEILKAEIEVTADKIVKKYGDLEESLTYTITKGGLKFEDKVSGKLTRQQGENIGEYEILKGTLSLSDNYIVKFVPSTLVIETRPITIYADAVSKYYGDEDPQLTYTIEGGIVFGDVLYGNIYREKPITDANPKLYEMTGKYLITSDFNNPNYSITFVNNYLTIKQREIRIIADNKSIYYGESDPELTYSILSGEILEGDILTGNIYRVQGNNAGKYDIRSNLTLGRNYKIIFTKGIFEIKPIEIYIKTQNYEKIYGQSNPVFEYEITAGALLGDDKLLGGVAKEEGEDVGVYKLISAFNNTNYNVILTENYLTIKPKEVYLSVAIYDKVYNGDTVAYIKQPVVSGLIDEGLSIKYDKENCARFESSDVGNHIKVSLFDIYLSGEKARNYSLILPNEVYGNITHDILNTENQEVVVQTKTNTELNFGTKLVMSDEVVDSTSVLTPNKQLVQTYNIYLEENESEKEIKQTVKVKFLLSKEFANRNNFYVYGTNKAGERVLLTCVKNGNYLEITTDNLGEFIVLTDNELWLDVSSYVSIGLLSLLCICFVISMIKKRMRKATK